MGMKQTAFGLVDLGRQGIKMKIIFVRHGEPDYSMLDNLENPHGRVARRRIQRRGSRRA